MPALADRSEARKLIERRHPEYTSDQSRLWGFLFDSLEGGDWYKSRVLDSDAFGFAHHYLIRHPREYPTPGELTRFGGAAGWAARPGAGTADKFELRRQRTPVPDFVAEVVRKHLSRIYAREVRREGNPPRYDEWAADVDGKGTSVDRWFRHQVAPLLYTLGTLDVFADHPSPPPGETIRTDADRRRLGLSRVVARTFQPGDVLWWRLNPDGSYREVLDREWHEDDEGTGKVERFRHWTMTDWSLYDADGELLDSGDHPYGRVPQVRLKIGTKHRCENIGATPLERAAELQREYYNRDSELILSDTIQAHPTLQGAPGDPERPGEDTVPVGTGWLLEMRENVRTGELVPFSVVDFPKGGAESLRANLAKLRDELDRTYALNKPAGGSATGGSGAGVVAQSGISKSYDAATLNDILGELSDTLADAETHIGRLVMSVASDGAWTPGPAADISVVYPKQFDLFSADELAQRWLACLELAREGRGAPETTRWVVGSIVRDHLIPGRSDDDYATTDAEIVAVMEAAEENAAAMAGLREQGESDEPEGGPPADDDEPSEDDDANPDESESR